MRGLWGVQSDYRGWSAGRRQSYIEDCQVCCKPNLLRVEYDRERGICDYGGIGIAYCGKAEVPSFSR